MFGVHILALCILEINHFLSAAKLLTDVKINQHNNITFVRINCYIFVIYILVKLNNGKVKNKMDMSKLRL